MKLLLTKKLLALFLVVIVISPLQSQILWQEDFSGYPNGTQNSGMWNTAYNDCDDGTINSGQNYWGVFNGEFRVNDIEGFNCTDEGSGPGGNNQNSFTTQSIDISGEACVNVRVDLRSTGTFECSFPGGPSSDPVGAYNGHDQLTVEYSVDGGPFTLFAFNGYICGNNGLPTQAQQDAIEGNNIIIRILLGNQANGENYYFDNIIVEANSTDITLPTLGPYCEAEGPQSLPPSPAGVSGTWSGTGVSGNTFDPSVA
ncbi:MAG: hypothetical protein GVY26_14905, partial [Bacteroidetes bacterium]|nr:hypothetical protein [Bacteroidota bacterium]